MCCPIRRSPATHPLGALLVRRCARRNPRTSPFGGLPIFSDPLFGNPRTEFPWAALLVLRLLGSRPFVFAWQISDREVHPSPHQIYPRIDRCNPWAHDAERGVRRWQNRQRKVCRVLTRVAPASRQSPG